MNASLCGFLEEALPGYEVHGILNGLQGLDEGRLVPLGGPPASYQKIERLPGAWLGSGRWPAATEDFERYAANLGERDIRKLALVGGNGTMWACRELERAARRVGCELAVVGIPKTVDNDLAGTDHAPGFASAARYVATMVRDIGRDLASMRNFEAVRVLETMGRNVGWLAMASGHLKDAPGDPPHLIYVPERPFEKGRFLREVEEAHRDHGYVVAVVSEGLIHRDREAGLRSPVVGGVSRELALGVEEKLGLPARGELLGMGQRSYSLAVSTRDREEARRLGWEAVRALRKGEPAGMLALARTGGPRYEVEITSVPFDRVAGFENPLPREWVLGPDRVHDGFRAWLGPLVGEDLTAYPPNATELRAAELRKGF